MGSNVVRRRRLLQRWQNPKLDHKDVSAVTLSMTLTPVRFVTGRSTGKMFCSIEPLKGPGGAAKERLMMKLYTGTANCEKLFSTMLILL